jgi:hypothetical protein
MLSRSASLPRHVLYKADVELLNPGAGKSVLQVFGQAPVRNQYPLRLTIAGVP